jgi:hypothetical protein
MQMSNSSKNTSVSFIYVSIMVTGTIISFTGISMMAIGLYKRLYYNDTKHNDYGNIVRMWF